MKTAPEYINIASIGSANLGFISVAEFPSNLPFEVKGVYWTYYTPNNVRSLLNITATSLDEITLLYIFNELKSPINAWFGSRPPVPGPSCSCAINKDPPAVISVPAVALKLNRLVLFT